MNLLPILSLLLACAQDPCPTWYTDLDADGYGVPDSGVRSCEPMAGRAEQAGDCNDGDPQVNPAAWDIPADGRDQDCDGEDLCAGALRVTGATVCGDQPIVLTQTTHLVPSGGCLCASTESLTVPGDTPNSDLSQLHSVAGALVLSLRQADVDLPALRDVGSLEAEMEGYALSAPALSSAGSLDLEDPGDVDLSALAECPALEINSPVGALDMSSLAEAESVRLIWSQQLQGWTLPPEARFEQLLISYSKGVGLPADLRVGELTLNYPNRPEWLLDWEVDSLILIVTTEAEIEGLSHLSRLEIRARGAASLPDLVELQTLENEAPGTLTLDALQWLEAGVCLGPLSAASLQELGTLDLGRGGSLYAPELRTLQQLSGASVVDLPMLQEAVTLEIGGGDLPSLRSVDVLETPIWGSNVASLPELESVGTVLLGRVYAPALETLPQGSLVVEAGGLESLRRVDGTLTLSGSGELPALRSVGEVLELDAVDALNSPLLLDLSALKVSGETPTQLPDPTPSGVRAVRFMPTEHVDWGTVAGGLLVDCDGARCGPPDLYVAQVQGAAEINGSHWTDLGAFGLGRVEGDLSYCLPGVPTAELDAWLDTIEILGTVEATCP